MFSRQSNPSTSCLQPLSSRARSIITSEDHDLAGIGKSKVQGSVLKALRSPSCTPHTSDAFGAVTITTSPWSLEFITLSSLPRSPPIHTRIVAPRKGLFWHPWAPLSTTLHRIIFPVHNPSRAFRLIPYDEPNTCLPCRARHTAGKEQLKMRLDCDWTNAGTRGQGSNRLALFRSQHGSGPTLIRVWLACPELQHSHLQVLPTSKRLALGPSASRRYDLIRRFRFRQPQGQGLSSTLWGIVEHCGVRTVRLVRLEEHGTACLFVSCPSADMIRVLTTQNRAAGALQRCSVAAVEPQKQIKSSQATTIGVS